MIHIVIELFKSFIALLVKTYEVSCVNNTKKKLIEIQMIKKFCHVVVSYLKVEVKLNFHVS